MLTAATSTSSRILVVRLGAMGDIIHALPAVASLSGVIPARAHTWVVEPKMGAAARGQPFHRPPRVAAAALRLAGLVERLARPVRGAATISRSISKASSSPRWPPPPRALAASSASIKSQLRERAAALFYSNKTVSRAAHVVDKNLELAAAGRRRHSVTGRSRCRWAIPKALSRPAISCLASPPGRVGAPSSGPSNTTRLWPRSSSANSASRWCSTARPGSGLAHCSKPARFDPRHPARPRP